MAKRKSACSLEDFISGYFKKAKFDKSNNLFNKKNVENQKSEKIRTKFVQYLKDEFAKEEIKQEYDLGFEINFGKPEAKLPILKAERKNLSCSIRKNGTRKTDVKEKRMDIPIKFLEEIKKLKMNESDAEILYKTKINWTEAYSNNKIYCTEQNCDFYTKIKNDDELTNHMITAHSYGEYPCTHPSCNFVGISKVIVLFHCQV